MSNATIKVCAEHEMIATTKQFDLLVGVSDYKQSIVFVTNTNDPDPCAKLSINTVYTQNVDVTKNLTVQGNNVTDMISWASNQSWWSCNVGCWASNAISALDVVGSLSNQSISVKSLMIG